MKFSLNKNFEYEMKNKYIIFMNMKKWKKFCESISS